MRTAAVGLIVALLSVSSAPATEARVRGPFLLLTLPALGTVTWRCDDSRESRFALGFRVPRDTADTHVRLHVRGRTVARRHILPGRSVRFPFLSGRVQQLDIGQGTGAGTLRAFVRVDFIPDHPSTYCFSYLPPRLDVRLLPRQ